MGELFVQSFLGEVEENSALRRMGVEVVWFECVFVQIEEGDSIGEVLRKLLE